MAESWFFWAVMSMLLQGSHAFLYKKLIEEHGEPRVVQVVIPALVCVLAAAGMLLEGTRIPQLIFITALIAAVQGVLFFLATAMRLEALRCGAPAHIVFPIVKSSVIFIIVLSAFLFDEWASLKEPRRLAGVSLAVIATFILLEWRRDGDGKGLNRGIGFALLAMLAGGGASLMAKYLFVSDAEVSIFLFMLLSNLTTLVLAIGVALSAKGTDSRSSYDLSIGWGIAMGLLSFGGFASFLQAIRLGDLSAVASINAMAIIIPVLLSSYLYRERLTLRKEVAVFLSIIALALIG